MAEIYKQQLEHDASGGTMLRQAPYRNYFAQGLADVSEGFRRLGEYIEYRDDKELASKMELVAKEVDADIVHWEDFSAEGLDSLMAQSMAKYDKAMEESSYDTQTRFNTYNPDARNLFELKTKEDILTAANKFIFEETQRDFNTIANDISEIKDPAQAKAALLTALDKVNSNKSGLLTVAQLGQLTDTLGHKTAAQAIGNAIVEGRVGDAELLLGDDVFKKFLGPEETLNFKARIKNLKTSKEKDEKAAPGYKERANFLISLRDGLYAMYGPNENIDATMNKLTEALRSGQSIGDQMVLEWVDGKGIPLKDLVAKLGIGAEALEYWDSTPMTTRQLAVNEYEKIVEPALPIEYRRRRSYLADSFMRVLDAHLVEDESGKLTVYDFSNMTNDELRDALVFAEELQWYRIGLDNSVQKNLDSFLNAVEARRAEAGKAMSIELDPIQQNMAGLTAGKTFLGGGNLTEAMISAAQNGEERPSVVDGIMKNAQKWDVYEKGLEAVGDMDKVSTKAKRTMDANIAPGFSSMLGALSGLARILASGELSPTRSNLPYFDDGGEMIEDIIAAPMGRLMKALGEVDKKGNLLVPKANTRRFMTYAIPVILGNISVKGNEDDIKRSGIKPGAINDMSVVDLALAMQDQYAMTLNDTITAQNTAGAYRDKLGPSVPEVYGIKNSDVFEMVETAFDIAREQGLLREGDRPDPDTLINIAFGMNRLVKDATPKTYVPAKNSGAQKRLDNKTKAMQQQKKVSK